MTRLYTPVLISNLGTFRLNAINTHVDQSNTLTLYKRPHGIKSSKRCLFPFSCPSKFSNLLIVHGVNVHAH